MTAQEAIQRRVARFRGNRTRKHVSAYERTHTALLGEVRKPWWRFW